MIIVYGVNVINFDNVFEMILEGQMIVFSSKPCQWGDEEDTTQLSFSDDKLANQAHLKIIRAYHDNQRLVEVLDK
jgi:hypothetical protein